MSLVDISKQLIGDVVRGYALFSFPTRQIDMIIPDVTIEEDHRDELIITDHPVETGSAISDHAFKRPVEVEMRCGWSDSTAGYEGYARSMYDALQALQKRREPFQVFTGKRIYQNMLIAGLAVVTDQYSEHTLMAVISLREVIIVSTSGGSGAGHTNPSPSMKPQATPPVDGGAKTLEQAPTAPTFDGVTAGHALG